MAFHVACPITCRRICYCELGFTQKPGFHQDISKLQAFLQDPWMLRPAVVSTATTIQVEVPPLEPLQLLGTPSSLLLEEQEPIGDGIRDEGVGVGVGVGVGSGGGGGRTKEESAWAQSVRAKRLELQRQAAEASVAAEDYVRRLEAGAAAMEVSGDASNNAATEDLSTSAVKIICRICFSGEDEGSASANKMVPCKTCNKKYHRSCLKVWAEYRDLFHWDSWSCPSCRSCEVCKRTGDPTKFKFCKRCDGAYHCYCQQPPHKNVSHGPFLCPKHTRCHSCGSTVPGSGVSTRWFLSYTNCDACGRLFVKSKYCPVCLKVYRDSEMTPMVCCDICQQWVHCLCDGISDEKYRQFDTDRNLHYKCPPCRGECYKVKDVEDAVRELWRRRDDSDRRLIASMRAAAGLPIEASAYPYSDDEEKGPVILKNEPGKTLKFSVKSITDSLTKKSKEDVMKSPAKKSSSKVSSKKVELLSVVNDAGRVGNNGDSHKPVEKEATVQPIMPRKLHIKGSTGKSSVESESTKGTKLVIHIGTKNKKLNSPPRSETPVKQKHTESVPVIDTAKINKGSTSNKASEKPSKSKIKFTNPEPPRPVELSTSNDPKPLLKLKFKNPYFEQKSSWVSAGPKEVEEEKTPVVKGQRSKRKRPSSSGRFEVGQEEVMNHGTGEASADAIDAEWILKKLGRDAIGKRVEVQEGSVNLWQRGMVSDVKDGTTSLSVRLDNGTSKTLELGKHKIRFISQKRSKK